jgi:hypothetical protein
MIDIVLATSNKGKIKEFNEMANKHGINFVSIKMPDVDENGSTFEENSLIKAKEALKVSNGLAVVSDDSGLCIDCLDGKPGIHTARFRNDLLTYEERGKALIELVNEKNTTRDAKFVCVITLIKPDGTYYHFSGETKGQITRECMGKNGHGYDPIFFSSDLHMTFGLASLQEKDRVSHRKRAFDKLIKWLTENELY